MRLVLFKFPNVNKKQKAKAKSKSKKTKQKKNRSFNKQQCNKPQQTGTSNMTVPILNHIK